ncbi:MAG: riboflavin synthase [bacterium]|nr:riboflavin synthase [bacterium]
MFSGIVAASAEVRSFCSDARGACLALGSSLFDGKSIRIGDSICVSGVCLTVVRHEGDEASFELASETLRCTRLGQLKLGMKVNVERSLKVGDTIDGHFVQGHVDAVSHLISRAEEANTIKLIFAVPRGFFQYIAAKGSITIDGVSLTVGEVNTETFSVYIIPHTAEVTTLGALVVGEQVNIEIDSLARYVVHALNARCSGE